MSEPANVHALVPREPAYAAGLAIWNREQLDVIKNLICPGASDSELALFAQVCARTGLDPFARQIYGLMRSKREKQGDDWVNVPSLSIQTSIDGFRLIAERTQHYGGQLGPYWCGPDGKWRDVWLSSDYPSAARVGVVRTDWKEPLYAVARWDSYVQTYYDQKQRKTAVGPMWQRMPDVMLAKCAESLALRRAFPAELSGLYTAEEMQQAEREQEPATAPYTVVDAAPPPAPGTPSAPATGWTDKRRAMWASGCEKAAELGLPVPGTPPEDASSQQVVDALRSFGEAVKAREAACTAYRALTAEARSLDLGVKDVDPATLPPGELAALHAGIAEMVQEVRAAVAEAVAPAAPATAPAPDADDHDDIPF